MTHTLIESVNESATQSVSRYRACSAAAFLFLCAALAHSAEPKTATDTSSAQGLAERGRYLVTIMSCHDCHTPFKMGANGPEPDMTRMLSGHPQSLVMPAPPALDPANRWAWIGADTNTAFAGPWGISFSANLTPDQSTGIGHWTDQTFIDTLRNARHEGRGRPLLPPMPAPFISQATDDDLRAIFAFLKSVPPIHNKVPQPIEPAGTE